MRELQPGLWHWQAPHPGWESSEPWDQNVSSYAIDDGERLLLFDPLGVPSEIAGRAAERETAIVLTSPWHERDSQGLVERLGVQVYTPSPDTAEDLLRTYDFTAPEGWISPDIPWLLSGDAGEAHLYAAGDRLPVGVQAFPGQKRNDLVLWVDSHRAVVAGDTLADFGEGPQINPRWISPDVQWLLHGDGGEAHLYAAGDRLPIGVQSFPGQKRNDLVLWVESHRAVVAGDTLADFGDGPQINPRWLSKDLTREQVVDGLRPLLELPVEHLLATHGGPFDRATLERALA
jgi:glyoxylase-like metal-dependent hydrolase (beta-lactamase superfamily II)